MTEEYNFQLKPAVREAIPPLVCMWGFSDGGKTLSMLRFARGYVGPEGKIAVIDTENKRALFFSEKCSPWQHLDLQPPFTPEKYNAAVMFCEKQGADFIIIDSGSHVWEGIGGVIDQADNSTTTKGEDMKGLLKWKKPKLAYKRMANNFYRSPVPIGFCIRAKESLRQVRDKIVKEGYTPIMEKNFIYEMTVSLHMVNRGKYNLTPWNPMEPGKGGSKIPGDLGNIFPADTQVNEEMGKKFADFVKGGAAVDPEYLKLKRDGADASMQGMSQFTAWGKTLKPDQRKKIEQHLQEWTKTAKDADTMNEDDAPSVEVGI